MVTGGFRTAQGMADAIANDGVDLIGLGRPLCLYPDAPASLLNGTLARFLPWEHHLRIGPGLLGPHSPYHHHQSDQRLWVNDLVQ
jgi:hypothetical protein